ncbi:MAG: nuclear transport factor 2 family protein [Candidatus Rokubacteria bacterium]|nr:nuclear transport factor 2 family protein [Candidatus Rokubacteria bacterium]
MKVEALDHLVLTVRDIAVTCDFYRRALGMEVVTFGQGRTAIKFGAQKINLHPAGREVEPKAARPTPGSADICLLSDEPLAGWIAHFKGLGVPIELGPVRRTGALGPIESIYVRDPDANLVEIANPVTREITKRVAGEAADPIAPLRAWLRAWQACVRAVDFAGGRALCIPDLLAFGTRAEIVQGVENVEAQQWRQVWPRIRDFTVRIDEARGEVTGDHAWVAARWDSLGTRPDGTTFPRPGRLTIALERRRGRWLARHTHFSLVPQP